METMDLQTAHEILGSAWTVWAMLIFAGILRWVLRPANRERFEQDARIPLKDEG